MSSVPGLLDEKMECFYTSDDSGNIIGQVQITQTYLKVAEVIVVNFQLVEELASGK